MYSIIRKHLNSNFVINVMTKEKLSQYVNPSEIHYGVYFLYKDDELMYIGRSFNVLKRMKSHIGKKKDWNKVKWITTPTKILAVDIEHAIIMNFPTPYNHVPKIVNSIPKTYAVYISDCRRTLRLYDEMVKEQNFRYANKILKNLNYYKDNVNMTLEEYEIEYNKKIKGEPHRLTRPL